VLIYVAGPYTADTDEGQERNTEEAMRAGAEILRRGHTPLIPHLSHYFDLWHERCYGERLPPETYYAWDNVLLERCDALLFLGPSKGANAERALAESLGMPVYTSVNQLDGGAE
jgi:hypothetical protein